MPKFSMRPILPRKFFDATGARNAIKTALRDEARDAARDINAATSTWTNKPRVTLTEAFGEVTVTITGKVFSLVDKGTPRHIIRGRMGGRLRFLSGFTPKTVPGSLQAGSGGRFGDLIFRRVVQHPGTKPRRITQTVAEKHEKSLQRRIQQAIASALE